MTPIIKTSRCEEYLQELESYKESLKSNPKLSFKAYCRQHSLSNDRLECWFNRQNIFINDIKQKAQEAAGLEVFPNIQKPGMFIPIRPENEVTAKWRNTELPRVDIHLPNKVRLSIRNTNAAAVINLIAMYADRGGN